MTRKDYVLIAEALKDSKPTTWDGSTEQFDNGAYTAWLSSVRMLCYRLSQNNPRFDRERFLAACGVDHA